jgi:hypothetical protein
MVIVVAEVNAVILLAAAPIVIVLDVVRGSTASTFIVLMV